MTDYKTEYWVIERYGAGVSSGHDTAVENLPTAVFANKNAVAHHCNQEYDHWAFRDEVSLGDTVEAVVAVVKRYDKGEGYER